MVIVKIRTTHQAEDLGLAHADAQRQVTFVQKLRLILEASIDNSFDRDLDSFFDDFLDRDLYPFHDDLFNGHLDSPLNNPLDRNLDPFLDDPIDVFDHLDGNFDALLDNLCFQDRKEAGAGKDP